MNSRLHRWWLFSCFAALLLASWAGGFGVAVTAVFIGIYLIGLVLIGPDEPEAEGYETADEMAGEEAEPYPDEPEPDPELEGVEPSDSPRGEHAGSATTAD